MDNNETTKKEIIGNREVIVHNNNSENVYGGFKKGCRDFVFDGWYMLPLILGGMATLAILYGMGYLW